MTNLQEKDLDRWIQNGRSWEDRMCGGYAHQTTYGEYDTARCEDLYDD